MRNVQLTCALIGAVLAAPAIAQTRPSAPTSRAAAKVAKAATTRPEPETATTGPAGKAATTGPATTGPADKTATANRLKGLFQPEALHQLRHSLRALGTGGWTGAGLGAGVQKLRYLPEAHTDFIFAGIGE